MLILGVLLLLSFFIPVRHFQFDSFLDIAYLLRVSKSHGRSHFLCTKTGSHKQGHLELDTVKSPVSKGFNLVWQAQTYFSFDLSPVMIIKASADQSEDSFFPQPLINGGGERPSPCFAPSRHLFSNFNFSIGAMGF